MKASATESNLRLVNKIKTSTLYQSYAKAFQTVTGLPLLLQPAHGSAEFAVQEGCRQNRFCELLNSQRRCQGCTHAHAELMRDSKEHSGATTCFAGFKESAVPVRHGEKTVAFLRTGQILHDRPKAQNFEVMMGSLSKEGFSDEEIRNLQEAYMKSKVVGEKDYQQVMMLLAIFSLQLSNLINQLVLAKNEGEPPLIARAKQYMREHLSERLTLEDVASAVGVSSFYFCKLFKQSTGMTFTEYVNRKRVEWAKTALLKPYARVTEVAFAVGYQSLSQFNRSFLKYAGESPTQHRKRMLRASREGAGSLAG